MADFEGARTIPDNLPNDSEGNSRFAEISYWIGLTYERIGQSPKASAAWHDADLTAETKSSLRGARNLERQVQSYFSELARQKLGQSNEANAALKDLLESANKALEIPPPRPSHPEAGAGVPRTWLDLVILGWAKPSKPRPNCNSPSKPRPTCWAPRSSLRLCINW